MLGDDTTALRRGGDSGAGVCYCAECAQTVKRRS
jgi:hypothetical protein